MKKAYKNTICIILLHFQFFVVGIKASDIDLYNNRLSPPEVSNLFHCHLAETSLFTGRMNMSVPLYQLSDPDFPMSLILSYDADGFMPRKHSGLVGYNWVLDIGGCISREVNGHADECCKYYHNTRVMGMLEFLRRETPSPDSIYSFSSSVFGEGEDFFTRDYGGNTYFIDYLPDVFHFDFCGHKGAFMIDNYGNPQIIKGDYVEVDISTLYQAITTDESQYMYYPASNLTIITLRTLDGYIYEFGGDASSVGCSVQIYPQSQNYCFATSIPQINTWFLKKITAPNSRTITFHYKSVGTPIDISTPLWLYNEEYVKYRPIETHDYNNEYLNMMLNPIPGTFQCVSSVTKQCVLDSIHVSGPNPLSIRFYYGNESSNMYPVAKYNIRSHSNLSPYNYQLNSLYVTSNGRTLKHVQFSYETKYSPNTNQENRSSWRFLKSLNIDGEGCYSFKYNHNTYPNLCEPIENETAIYDMDGYWLDNSLAGLLDTVVFPTGGKEVYQYEKHYVSFRRRYAEDWILQDSASGNLLYEKKTESAYRNGARIKKILTYDKNGSLIDRKEYTYYSGIYYDRHLVKTNTNTYHMIDNLTAYNISFYPVGYPKVSEAIYSHNNELLSRNDYHFAIDEDVLPLQFSMNVDANSISQNPNHTWRKYYNEVSTFLMFNERLITLGKLVGIERFLNGTTLSQTECFYYNNARLSSSLLYPEPLMPNFSGDTIVACFSGDVYHVCRKLYTYPDVHNQTTSFSYEGNNKLQKTDAFQYDGMQRVKKQITFDSNNRELFTYYTYPDEIQTSPHSSYSDCKALFLLKKKKQIGRPIEVYSGYTSQNNELVTSGKLVKYYTDLPTTPIGAPTPNWNDYHVYPSQEYNLAITSPISNYQPITCLTGTLLSIDSRYLLSYTYQFDNLLRPTSVTPNGSLATTYTWDGFYPHTVSIGNQTTTYTSIPYVGITSITDPKGLTTYYDYDPYGRLVEVYHLFNNTKQIINAYDYHVSTE